MVKARKEKTVKEADAAAAEKKNAEACKEGILEEALALLSGETHSVQQLLAYARQWQKYEKKK